jgi:FAD/FMN-containing dehydrogenase
VDLIVWPGSYEDVVAIVKACQDNNACIIPYGGMARAREWLLLLLLLLLL